MGSFVPSGMGIGAMIRRRKSWREIWTSDIYFMRRDFQSIKLLFEKVSSKTYLNIILNKWDLKLLVL